MDPLWTQWARVFLITPAPKLGIQKLEQPLNYVEEKKQSWQDGQVVISFFTLSAIFAILIFLATLFLQTQSIKIQQNAKCY